MKKKALQLVLENYILACNQLGFNMYGVSDTDFERLFCLTLYYILQDLNQIIYQDKAYKPTEEEESYLTTLNKDYQSENPIIPWRDLFPECYRHIIFEEYNFLKYPIYNEYVWAVHIELIYTLFGPAIFHKCYRQTEQFNSKFNKYWDSAQPFLNIKNIQSEMKADKKTKPVTQFSFNFYSLFEDKKRHINDIISDLLMSPFCSHVRDVDLTLVRLDKRALNAVCQLVPQLERLDLSGIKIPYYYSWWRSSELHFLIDALKMNTCLKELYLRGINLTDEGLSLLLDALQSNTHLETLVISDNKLTAQGGKRLFMFLKSKPAFALRHLDLSDNGEIFAAESSIHFYAWINQVSDAFQYLCLDGSAFSVQFLKGLFNAIPGQELTIEFTYSYRMRLDREIALCCLQAIRSFPRLHLRVPKEINSQFKAFVKEFKKIEQDAAKELVVAEVPAVKSRLDGNRQLQPKKAFDNPVNAIIQAVYEGDIETLTIYQPQLVQLATQFKNATDKLTADGLAVAERSALLELKEIWQKQDESEKRQSQPDMLTLKESRDYIPLFELSVIRGHIPIVRWLIKHLEGTLGKKINSATQKSLLKKAVANSFKKMSLFQTKVLDLSDELLAVKDVFQGLVTLLPHDKNIKELQLHHNDLSTVFNKIMDALKENKTVVVLDLSCCHISDKQIPHLIEMLQQNRHIKTIRLQANPSFSYQGVQQLIKALMTVPRINTAVETIDISHNPQLEVALSEKLADTLKQNKINNTNQPNQPPAPQLPVYQVPSEIKAELVREHDPKGVQQSEDVVNVVKTACDIQARENERQELQKQLEQPQAPADLESIARRLKALDDEFLKMRQNFDQLVTKCQVLEAQNQRRLERSTCFDHNPRLRKFYMLLARKLEELFVGCKAVGSQLVRYTDRGYAGYILLAGEIASDKILSLETIQAVIKQYQIPYISHIPSLFEMASALTNLREKHALQKISYYWSLQELQRAALLIAERLTERYQAQLLALPEKIYEEESLYKRAYHFCHEAINTITNSQNFTVLDELVNYASFRILNALKDERITRFEDDDEISLQELVAQAVDSLAIPMTGLTGFVKARSDSAIAFSKEKQWTVSGFYLLPGIQCLTGERYHDDNGKRTQAILYGYRSGSRQEAEQLGFLQVAVGEYGLRHTDSSNDAARSGRFPQSNVQAHVQFMSMMSPSSQPPSLSLSSSQNADNPAQPAHAFMQQWVPLLKQDESYKEMHEGYLEWKKYKLELENMQIFLVANSQYKPLHLLSTQNKELQTESKDKKGSTPTAAQVVKSSPFMTARHEDTTKRQAPPHTKNPDNSSDKSPAL